MDFTYLQPPRQAFKIKKLKQEQFQIVDGKPYRKIFENVKYTEDELKKLDSIKEYLKEKQPNKLYQDAFVLKMTYLTVGTFSPLSVFQNIKKHQEWFQNPNIASQRNQGRKILEEGTFYSYGRDLEYSPIVYFYPSRVDTTRYSIVDYCNALYMLLQPIQQYMLIPGINQTFNIVMDMQNKNFPLPLSAAKDIIQKVVFAYPYRLKRLFFVHTSQGNDLAMCIKEALKYFNYQVKPEFISRMEEFRRYIPDEEREQKYGGNLQDLNEFWPISLATKYEEEKSYFIVENTSETDYQSLINEEIMFQGLDAQESGCGVCGKKNCQIY